MNYVFDKPTICSDFPWIGGGADYDPTQYTVDTDHPCGDRITRDDADVIVSSVDDLDDSVSSGTIIWIEGDARIDLGSRRWEFGADNVTIASDRSLNGSDGALLYTDDRVSGQFRIDGNGSRVTSLRIRGPEPDSFGSDGYPASEAIAVNGDRVEVDNCAIRGYSHAAIEVGDSTYPDKLHIHHCDLCDNNSKGLGYGVTVFRGHPLIRACYLDNNRHSVAGDGASNCGWTTVDCIGGEHQRLHAWDMHEDPHSSGDAGTRMILERNVLLSTHNWYDTSGPSDYGQETVSIRATPRESFEVRFNAFTNTKPAEPMDDQDNDAFNVFHCDTFAEGNVHGVDSNTFEWQDGDPLPDGIGPSRDPTVTGYTGDDSSTDENYAPPPDDSDSTSDSTMSNPTADKSGQYEVTIHGNGSTKSAYVLVGRNGLAEVNSSLESNDRLVGRAIIGYVSTMTDTFTVDGPVDVFERVGGDSGIELEVDGTKYSPSAFDCSSSSSSSDGPDGTIDVGAVDLNNTTYDVSVTYDEQ